MGQGDTLLNALAGAAVTVVLSFTGFSALLGGAVAGYLQDQGRGDGARVGAVSGAIATLPFVLLVVIVFGAFGLMSGTMMRGGMGGPGMMGGGFGLLAFGLFLVLVVAWNVGLGALGGYLGVYVGQEFREGRADTA
jgi:hypothetical protein